VAREAQIKALNATFFSNRHVSVGYHTGDQAAAYALPDHRRLSFHEDALDLPPTNLLALCVHELAHIATGNEVDHHGPRWRRKMVEIGVSPDDGTILPGSPLRVLIDNCK
jgi:SprT-like family